MRVIVWNDFKVAVRTRAPARRTVLLTVSAPTEGARPVTAKRFGSILVVEDNEAELDLLCEILKEEDFQVVGCASAAEAIEQVQRQSFGVAVVDLRLPDLSGTQLLERIRRLDGEIRVIIFTGAASRQSVKEALSYGAFAYVEKLSDPAELLRFVHRGCRERVDRYAADLEAAMAARTEEFARLSRELEEFAAAVARELRTPLSAISGCCHVLKAECAGQVGRQASEHIGRVVDSVAEMNRLIGNLLEYAGAGRCDEPRERVDLGFALDRALANLAAEISEHRAEIHRSRLPEVQGNEGQLVRLFQNLVGNAVKFHRPGRRPRIDIDARREGDAWTVSVADDGIGIDPADQQKIFEPFRRVHGPHQPGTGIGLPVCKRIVERHGGRIWVESTRGHGSTFYVALPAPVG